MTIHKSKGLEFDSVYLVGLEDSAFWNFKYQPDEDRCAFFVALSRAQRQATFTFCRHRMGRDQSHVDIRVRPSAQTSSTAMMSLETSSWEKMWGTNVEEYLAGGLGTYDGYPTSFRNEESCIRKCTLA